jgi:hypothetical protein
VTGESHTREGTDVSAKSVAEKLTIKPNTTLWLSDVRHLARIEPLPEGVAVAAGMDEAMTAVIFADDGASLREALTEHRRSLRAPSSLWIAYPKANRADINRDTIWPIVGEHGLRPISQIAIDDTWSALRFRPLADGEAPFTGGRK